MPLPLTAHYTTRRDHCQESESETSTHDATTQPAATYLPDNQLESHHLKDIIKTDRVSIQVSAPGWIIFAAISLVRFMGKSTGSTVNIGFLP